MGKRKTSSSRCRSSSKVATNLLLSFLAISTTTLPVVALLSDGLHDAAKQAPLLPYLPPKPIGGTSPPDNALGEHSFTLRHVFHHGTYLYPDLHRRLDVSPNDAIWSTSEDGVEREKIGNLQASSNPINIQRLADRRISVVEPLLSAARIRGQSSELPQSSWVTEQVAGPNITDKKTILALANIAANAYVGEPGTEDWSDVGRPFNHSQNFGWEQDGLRGHIYADKDNGTIIIGIKGTSRAVFDGVETTTNDKENDNLYFSCCCGQGGQYLWRTVCDCMTTTYTCNETCLLKSMTKPNRYYAAALELYGNVTEIYPNSNVWVTGHSLGGAMSGLIGLTFGLPAVGFEAIPEALAASRLGIPSPPDVYFGGFQTRTDTGVYHFGHTADPVFEGSCNAATSACTLGGYALQTGCHAGKVCVYDVVKDKGWRVGIGTHGIRSVIKDVIQAYDTVPVCETDSECVDCYNWKRIHSNGSETTTSKTSSSTSTAQTRTSTCKTPGWWGCLDESTTSGATTSTSSPISTTTTTATFSTSATSTCKTPGWFGCKDIITTTTTITSGSTISTTITPSLPTSLFPPTSQAPKTSCATPGLIWGCRDESKGAGTHQITAPPKL